MACNGVCHRYKAQKPVGMGRYPAGQSRCQICEIFIKYAGLWCPCCNYRLRKKPRNIRYKAKLRGVPIPERSKGKRLMGFTDDGQPILEDVA